MNLEIVTPDKKVFSGEVNRVQMPGIDGLFEILNNHAPLISALSAGIIKITGDSNKETFNITGGFAEVLNNNVVILAESIVKQ